MKIHSLGFQVFTAVIVKSIIFWDMTACSSLSSNRRFGGIYRFHLQGRRNKFSKNQQASRWQLLQRTTRRHPFTSSQETDRHDKASTHFFPPFGCEHTKKAVYFLRYFRNPNTIYSYAVPYAANNGT
jgi:hypothetical protein